MTWDRDSRLSLADIFASIAKHKFTFLAVALVVFSAFAAAWILLPREYGSEGRLFVQMGRGIAGLDPNPQRGKNVSIQDTRETEIRSVAELIKSHGLLEQVVDEVGAERVLENSIKLPSLGNLTSFLPDKSAPKSDGMSSQDYEDQKQREKAVRHLYRNLEVEIEKKTSVVTIFVTAASPQLAQELVDTIIEKAQQKHVEVHAVKGSHGFFDTEFRRQENELASAEESRRKFRNENQFLTVDQARFTLNSVLNNLEHQLVDVNIDMEQSRAAIAQYDAEMKNVSDKIEMPTLGKESLSTEGAQTKLYERLAERARLMARYSEDHPEVVQINQEIEKLEKQVTDLPKQRTETVMAANEVYQNLKVDMVREIAKAKSLEKRRDEILSRKNEAIVKLESLNVLKVQSDKLDRDVEIARQYLDIYITKRGEAMVNEQLDQNSISDLVVAQAGTLVLKKVGPKGSILLPLGLLFGLMGGTLAALVLDRKKYAPPPSVDLEADLDVPVMVNIPRVHSSQVVNS